MTVLELPVDMFEITRVWDWTGVQSEDICFSCKRHKPVLKNTKGFTCCACATLSRCYNGTGTARLGCSGPRMLYVSEKEAHIWLPPEAEMGTDGVSKKEKKPLVFSSNVNVHWSTTHIADAFAFVLENDENRQIPYLFINFNDKKSPPIETLRLNIDADMVAVSGCITYSSAANNEANLTHIFIDRLRALADVDVTLKGANRQRLLAAGFTENDFKTPEWQAARVLKGDYRKWY